jgi:hypothetical protein
VSGVQHIGNRNRHFRAATPCRNLVSTNRGQHCGQNPQQRGTVGCAAAVPEKFCAARTVAVATRPHEIDQLTQGEPQGEL